MIKKVKIFFTCLILISLIFSVPGSTEKIIDNISNENKLDEIQSLDIFEYEIFRDEYGVPHVFSDSKEGLAFGAGYAIAQDRLWQADVFRRQATGRLAEIGLANIEYDYWNRLSGYSKEENTEVLNDLASPYK